MSKFNQKNGSLSFLLINLKNQLFQKYQDNVVFLEPNLFGENEFVLIKPMTRIKYGSPVGFICKNEEGMWELDFHEEQYEELCKFDLETV